MAERGCRIEDDDNEYVQWKEGKWDLKQREQERNGECSWRQKERAKGSSWGDWTGKIIAVTAFKRESCHARANGERRKQQSRNACRYLEPTPHTLSFSFCFSFLPCLNLPTQIIVGSSLYS
ncbi:hypothetical protein Ancab_023392 [Ancistrocladus abbreviatus]